MLHLYSKYSEGSVLIAVVVPQQNLSFIRSLNIIIPFNLTDLRTNRELNQEAAQLNEDIADGENFTMANFTYSNSVVVSQMFQHLQNTSFPGLSVSI